MKKMKFWNYASKFLALSLVGSMLVFTSCKEEEVTPPAGDPIATFTFEISADNYLSVTFNSAGAQNAASYAWNFGDGNVATEANPTHVYSAEGDYSVSLVVTNADGKESNTFTSDITITDPDAALKLLTGEVSKTWKLIREGAALGVGPSEAEFTLWFAAMNNGSRNCIYDDEFTFTREGGFEFNDGGTMFGEANVYAGTDKESLSETCFEATEANMTVDGVNNSAWLSSTSHTFDFDSPNNRLTLIGLGAWMGSYKLANSEEVTVPQESAAFDVKLVDGGTTGVDTLETVWVLANSNVWKAIYVSYDDPSKEPALAGPLPNAGFTYVKDETAKSITVTNTSTNATSYSWDFGDGTTSTDENPAPHVYANDGIYSVVLTATSEFGESTKTESVSINISGLEDINFDFETDELTWGIFGGTDDAGTGVTLARIDNPDATGINTSTKVMEINQSGDNIRGYSGISTTLTGRVDFTNKQTMKIKVWSPKVGAIVKLKFEQTGNPGVNKEIDATTTVANGWEELTYTFEVGDSGKWDVLVLFFDFQTVPKTEASIYYFDDIILE